ncbi:MAG: heparinase II/III family protein, partial [Alcaligenaceae bacterium]
MFKTLGLYWHTLRYLKPVQIYGRLWFRLRQPQPDLSPAPSLRVPTGQWVAGAARAQSLTSADTFFFLNQVGSLAELGWDAQAVEKLWRYNQHYFDDLNAEGAVQRSEWHLALIQNWLQHNHAGQGTGWEPYPASLRIVNWLKWTSAGNTLPDQALHSLAVQARWLTKRLERHLLGNHYFANAKALVFAGLMFEGAEAQAWLKKGLAIIAHQLPEQVLSDGGNFERSPMYHSIFFEDLLDLINAARAWPGLIANSTIAGWQDVATRMAAWLMGMTHPDGQIALFNDAAFGVTPPPAALSAYACRLDLAVVAPAEPVVDKVALEQWQDSGYIRLTAANAVALLDVAPIGPDYLPSHANADTLSFELSLFGQRVIVNGGTSRYGSGPERLRERQTAAHSTVEIDGHSSSEVWGGFRVARRAYPLALSISQQTEQVTVACSHTGYQHLSGRAVHRRQWAFTATSLTVTDCVSGRFNVAIARYLFHPDLKLTVISPTVVQINVSNAKIAQLTILAGTGRLVVGQHSAEFGRVK